MASFKVTFKASVAKDLKRLDRLAAHRVLRAVESLRENPFPNSSKKLIGSEHTFRIRVGDYRVIYIVNKQGREIEIQRVRHRRDVYL
ncbi:MAG: type II toxin-antitoxin system RelE family toxin [Pseudomonadota bacterium]|jgi:mRNA interferase RelE/StbE